MSQHGVRYGQDAVYGSLAYDFNNPELYPETEYSESFERRRREKAAEQAAPSVGTRADARAKQSVSPAAAAGIFVAAVLAIIFVMSQIKLIEISDANVGLQSQLSELQSENAKLRIAYESAFNLAEIEEYATNELGMQKPTADQICYIDTASPDKAVVIAVEEQKTVFEKATGFFSELVAYFR